MTRPTVVLGMNVVISLGLILYTILASGDLAEDKDKKEAEAYLRKYEYLSSQMIKDLADATNSNDSFKSALISFQSMVGLEETGELTNETLRWMRLPRCSCPDMSNIASIARRKKRYALEGSKWPKTVLTYNFTNPTNPTPGLSALDTKKSIASAFKLWADVAALTISKSDTSVADMTVSFVSGDHKDGHPFDGRGGALAHAYFAQGGGNLHFDADEAWTTGSNGANLIQAAAHALGHSLGLAHSHVFESVMSPFVKEYTPDFNLHSDDIAGIQHIYGAKRLPSKTVELATKRPTSNKWCNSEHFKIDAMLSINEIRYAFRGRQYAQLDQYGIVPGYPKDISATWPDLPSNLDAALFWSSNLASYTPDDQIGIAYFFKDSKCWMYTVRNTNNFTLVPDFPKEISKVFLGVPNKIDAAFLWSGNGNAYFIKGNQYYRFKSGGRVDKGFPRLLSIWKGLPETIDAAFYSHSPRRTYFFKDGGYYRFNDITFKVDAGYPRPIAQTWFGCPDLSSSLNEHNYMSQELDEEGDQFLHQLMSSAACRILDMTMWLTLFVLVLVLINSLY